MRKSLVVGFAMIAGLTLAAPAIYAQQDQSQPQQQSGWMCPRTGEKVNCPGMSNRQGRGAGYRNRGKNCPYAQQSQPTKAEPAKDAGTKAPAVNQ